MENGHCWDSGMPEFELRPAKSPISRGFEASCPNYEIERKVHRADEHDIHDGLEYFEFIRSACFTILLTFQRAKTEEAQACKTAMSERVCSATCPHCGALNTFPDWSSTQHMSAGNAAKVLWCVIRFSEPCSIGE
jgi:hypothetical protein